MIRIKARLYFMAASEIMTMIDRETMAEIKATDPKPIFKAFVVGQEGESSGNLIGIGNVIKRWFARAVEMLHEKIKPGLELFHGHGASNDNTGRLPIGRVVGKKMLDVAGKFSSVVACYILPEFRNLPLDVASVETDIQVEADRTGVLTVVKIDAVTGIALGNSAIDTPGFPGATLLGQLQAFKKKSEEGNVAKPTAEGIRQLIREAELQPSDVFTVGEITADPIVTEQAREKGAGPELHYQLRDMKRLLADSEKRLTETEKERKALADQIKTKDEALKTGQIESAKTKVGSLFEKQKTERKLDDKLAKYVQARLPNFTPAKPEELDKEFNTFLDAQVEDYKKISKDVFGIEIKADDKGEKKGGEPDETKDVPAGDEYLNPLTNPMIKLD